MSEVALVGGEIFSIHFFGQKHLIFTQNLAPKLAPDSFKRFVEMYF
jgi:hypothetical protein